MTHKNTDLKKGQSTTWSILYLSVYKYLIFVCFILFVIIH